MSMLIIGLALLSSRASAEQPGPPYEVHKYRTSLDVLAQIKDAFPKGAEVKSLSTATCTGIEGARICAVTYIIKEWPSTEDIHPEDALQALVQEYLKRCMSNSCEVPASALKEVHTVKIVSPGSRSHQFNVPLGSRN